VLADSGYVTEGNFTRAEEQQLRLLAPLGKDPATHRISNPAGRRDLAKLPATARAVRRMRHHRGRAGYKLRAQTVEPVFGQIKTCQKMTIMSRRGFGACRSEWLLAATAHNLRKLHTHRRSASHTGPGSRTEIPMARRQPARQATRGNHRCPSLCATG